MNFVSKRSWDKATPRSRPKVTLVLDSSLLLAVGMLLLLGTIMVGSASFAIADSETGRPFFYVQKQMFYVLMGLGALAAALHVEVEKWRAWAVPLWMTSVLLLIAVLIPGVGKVVNGSARWLPLGFFHLQASEVAKFASLLYLAYYLDKCHEDIAVQPTATFLRPMAILAVMLLLILLEPDFGAVVVIASSAFAMMVVAGFPKRLLFSVCGLGIIGFGVLAISAPYRLARLGAFLDPWADQYNSGYQLTQALIAFGRGEWFGAGLGMSVQKLFYLPEAHTDFLFAILSEELGLLGGLSVILLFGCLLYRGYAISSEAARQEKRFAAYLSFGLTTWLWFQAFINIGVNSGLLPTKGLTLPLMSAGGSSMVVSLLAIGVLLKIHSDNENKMRRRHAC